MIFIFVLLSISIFLIYSLIILKFTLLKNISLLITLINIILKTILKHYLGFLLNNLFFISNFKHSLYQLFINFHTWYLSKLSFEKSVNPNQLSNNIVILLYYPNKKYFSESKFFFNLFFNIKNQIFLFLLTRYFLQLNKSIICCFVIYADNILSVVW